MRFGEALPRRAVACFPRRRFRTAGIRPVAANCRDSSAADWNSSINPAATRRFLPGSASQQECIDRSRQTWPAAHQAIRMRADSTAHITATRPASRATLHRVAIPVQVPVWSGEKEKSMASTLASSGSPSGEGAPQNIRSNSTPGRLPASEIDSRQREIDMLQSGLFAWSASGAKRLSNRQLPARQARRASEEDPVGKSRHILLTRKLQSLKVSNE